MKFFMLLLGMSVAFLSCNASENQNNQNASGPDSLTTAYREAFYGDTTSSDTPAYRLPYDMKNASAEFKLSNKLIEISGLSMNEDGSKLLAVNDEQGKIFFLDKSDGDIKEDNKFEKGGDYEGIEQVGEIVYVVNSSGSVFEVKKADKKDPKTKKFNTHLNSDNDVEGLGYDAKNNRLLLACKNKPGKKSEYAGKRAVYAFDLKTESLSETPVLLVDLEEIQQHVEKKNWLLEELLGTFAPSGIAVHPQTDNIYILSSVGKLLVVLNPDGKLIHVEELDKKEYRQPEGLCFDQDGTLYLSSEGKGGKGRVYRFDVKE